MRFALPQDAWSRLLRVRFPTIIGLVLLMVGVGAGIVLVGQGTGGFLPRASADTVPKQVRITNITDRSFTVSFLTDAASGGFIQYGTQPTRTTTQVRDDRDQLASSVGSYTTHHITVQGLQANTQYYFRVGSEGRTLYDNNGEAFSVRTAPAVTTPPPSQTAYGIVRNQVGNPAGGALVYLTIEGASPISALVKPNGSWAATISSLRTRDLSATFSIVPTTVVKVEVLGAGQGEKLDAQITGAQLTPAPELKFGQAPDTTVPEPTPTVTPSTQGGQGGPEFGALYSESEATATTAGPVQIGYPQREGEVITTTQPELSGTGPADSYLQIEVHSSEPINGVVQTDANGNWRWTPPADLDPGEHTVTLTYTDAGGNQQRVQRTFLVQADTSGLTPSFVSTPSAVVVPTPSPTPASTATPRPTATLRPTPMPTPIAATMSALPVSGSTTNTLGLMLLALSFFAVGAWATHRMMQKRG